MSQLKRIEYRTTWQAERRLWNRRSSVNNCKYNSRRNYSGFNIVLAMEVMNL